MNDSTSTNQTSISSQDTQQHGTHEAYVVSPGTVRQHAQVPGINTNAFQHNISTNPSPRLRVAFNRETNFMLNPQHPRETSREETSTLHQDNPRDAMTDIDPNANISSLIHVPDSQSSTPSPKTTTLDLQYHKPGLLREKSGFDDETTRARHFARQVFSRKDESPPQRRRRTPQKVELRMYEQQDRQRDLASGSAASFGLSEWDARADFGGGGEDVGGDVDGDDRGRRRRRIGSELDCDMADA
ncbi:hypothetical protein Slin15195_G093870 [Septoria linicola]|uniref:Uncharacterized protein n=1 Tax=Septoria linicola TaxID=215465 RepID=A0A9Q9B1W9_9PEZI|nr:hypothetical protein Slin15195_G093870 [Septoria linicola]